MIINGSSRSNGSFFARHLMRADHNERVTVVEIRGLAAETIGDAFREMKAIACGTRCTNYFYHANLNTREDEHLTAEQWAQAADRLERELGLLDQARFVVEHEKAGRTHRHIVWSRIDVDSMTAISDSLTYPKHERVARELEAAFGHEPVDSVLVKDRQTPRPERNPRDWEGFRGQDSQLDPKAIKAEVTALWQRADSGAAFAAALEDQGYVLVRGDRRDFCIVDRAGDEHSLARRIAGVKAADIRERMADVDREALPSVSEGRELARLFAESAGGGDAPVEAPAEEVGAEGTAAAPDDFAAVHAETMAKLLPPDDPGLSMFLPEAKPEEPAAFEAVHAATVAQAAADTAVTEREEAAAPGSRFDRVRAWWNNMREHVAGWHDYVREQIDQYRNHWNDGPEQAATPGEDEPQL